MRPPPTPLVGKVYEVGGSVRDGLLGLASVDRDYVVVGGTVEAMLAAGFRPVGSDFPVFLHPKTHAEYALARTERKTAPGYKGFVFHASPEVTLEMDLQRRDLTINAMARDADGSLIDPHGGARDLQARVLRHVSAAFAEDPVRVLRVARLAARFANYGFSVAPETMALMSRLVSEGEIEHLVAERVWQELARGLMEANPSVMFQVLRASGALQRVLPELDGQLETMQQNDNGTQFFAGLEITAKRGSPLQVRFAALCCTLDSSSIEALSARLRAPSECRELAIAVSRWWREIEHARSLGAHQLLALLDGCDALRRPARFAELLAACSATEQSRSLEQGGGHHGREEVHEVPYGYVQGAWLMLALARLQSIDYRSVAKSAAERGVAVSAAVTDAKQQALFEFINEEKA